MLTLGGWPDVLAIDVHQCVLCTDQHKIHCELRTQGAARTLGEQQEDFGAKGYLIWRVLWDSLTHWPMCATPENGAGEVFSRPAELGLHFSGSKRKQARENSGTASQPGFCLVCD